MFSPKVLTDVAYMPRVGAGVQKLKFSPSARSPRYEYRGLMPLRFVDPETREVVAEAIIPAGLTDVLLLFTPMKGGGTDGAGKLRFQIAVLDDGAARHGAGGLAIINLSGLSLRGTVNKQSVTVEAGLNPTLKVGGAAVIKLTSVVRQRTYRSYAGTVKLASNERALLLLFPPAYAGSLEVQARVLVDRPPAAKEPRK